MCECVAHVSVARTRFVLVCVICAPGFCTWVFVKLMWCCLCECCACGVCVCAVRGCAVLPLMLLFMLCVVSWCVCVVVFAVSACVLSLGLVCVF